MDGKIVIDTPKNVSKQTRDWPWVIKGSLERGLVP